MHGNFIKFNNDYHSFVKMYIFNSSFELLPLTVIYLRYLCVIFSCSTYVYWFCLLKYIYVSVLFHELKLNSNNNDNYS